MTNPPALTVRPATPQDRVGWEPLWRAYLAFYETELPAAQYDITWQRFFSDNPYDPRCLVAEQDGTLVGLVHHIMHRHGWKEAHVCYLQDLYADPSVRGTGVGRALIEAVYEVADARGDAGVYWLTQDHNRTARQLYDRVATLTPFIKYQR